MKTINTTSATKLTVRFDRELMTLLTNDLKARKAKTQYINTQLNAA